MFITGYQLLNREIEKIPILKDKKIQVLVKPVMLREIEKTMLKLTEYCRCKYRLSKFVTCHFLIGQI
jgi:hypothetical protein